MSSNKKIKGDILITLSNILSEFGFKLKGSTFIREFDSGLYQIIDIGLGPSTSIKANHIGLGFGITTEEWLNNLTNYKRPKILTSTHCELRDIYCRFTPISDETCWYPIPLNLSDLINKINSYIQNSIIPYLDKLKTKQEIINMWRQYKHHIGLAEGRHQLAIGTLLFINNEEYEGKKMLEKLLVDKKDNIYFTSIINKIIEKGN